MLLTPLSHMMSDMFTRAHLYLIVLAVIRGIVVGMVDHVITYYVAYMRSINDPPNSRAHITHPKMSFLLESWNKALSFSITQLPALFCLE